MCTRLELMLPPSAVGCMSHELPRYVQLRCDTTSQKVSHYSCVTCQLLRVTDNTCCTCCRCQRHTNTSIWVAQVLVTLLRSGNGMCSMARALYSIIALVDDWCAGVMNIGKWRSAWRSCRAELVPRMNRSYCLRAGTRLRAATLNLNAGVCHLGI